MSVIDEEKTSGENVSTTPSEPELSEILDVLKNDTAATPDAESAAESSENNGVNFGENAAAEEITSGETPMAEGDIADILPPDENDILDVRHLKKYFPASKNFFGKPLTFLKAVDDVSFTIKRGQTLGIVGESGCGKTTLGRTILKLHEPTEGKIFFEGQDIFSYKPSQMRPLRTKMQIIFQDPYSSLPPRYTIGDTISEAAMIHNLVPKSELRDYTIEIMRQCGLQDYYYDRYPHEFSGGQRQRICIARALSVQPEFVVCDEPVSALDVSIQAQIINLLKDLQTEKGLTYMFISHDLSVVEHISDRVGVMYLGSMAEIGDTKDIFANPCHPYTQALLSAIPVPDPHNKKQRILLEGDIPSPVNPPKGCKFHTRCIHAMDICSEITPELKDIGGGHCVACHLCDK